MSPVCMQRIVIANPYFTTGERGSSPARASSPPSMRSSSILQNDVHRELKLNLSSPVVVCRDVERAIESEFGAEDYGTSHPMSPHESFLRVARPVAGALAFDIVQEIGTNRDVIARRELFFKIVDHGPFRGKAANLARGTERSVRAFFRFYRAKNAGHVPFIHEPGLGRHMPRLAELVIPGIVEHLQVVISVPAVVDAIHTRVHVVVAVVECITDAGRRGRLGIGSPGRHIM